MRWSHVFTAYDYLLRQRGRFGSDINLNIDKELLLVEEIGVYSSLMDTLFDFDHITYSHSMQVMLLSMYFGKALGLLSQDVATIGVNGLVHDLGKLNIPQEIICSAGRLLPEEDALIKLHPLFISEFKLPAQYTVMALYHHERVTGLGYPHGVSDIPFIGKLGAIVDVYDALSAHRTYRASLTNAEIAKIMFDYEADGFDSGMLDVFKRALILPATGSGSTVIKLG